MVDEGGGGGVIRGRRGLQHDESDDPLHLDGIRHPHHTGFGDRGVLIEYRLHLRRIDVEAGRLDHPLQPHAEIEEAVRILASQVTRMQPHPAIGMAAQRLAGGLGLVEVALHQRRTADADLAFLADRHRVRTAGMADAGQHVRKRHADGTLAITVQRHRHDRRHRLGQTVAFQQADVTAAASHHRLEALLHRPWQRIGAREGGAQKGPVDIGKSTIIGQCGIQGGHANQQTGTLAPQQPGHAGGIEARHQYRPATRHESGVHAYAESETMEDRQDRQDRIGRAELSPGGGLHALRNEIAMRQHDALGPPRGAAGKQDRGRIMRAACGCRRRRMSRGQQFAPPKYPRVGRNRRNMPALAQPENQPLGRRQIVTHARQQQMP